MRILIKNLSVLFVLLLPFTVQAAAANTNVQAETIWKVSARYLSELSHNSIKPAAMPAPWQLIRDEQQVEIRQQNTGERWLRLDDNQLSYSWIHHGEKLVVHYSPADLRILEQDQHWLNHASLINPALLQQLDFKEEADFEGNAVSVYTGSINGQALEVHWLVAYQLPALVIQQKGPDLLKISLQQLEPLEEAKEQFTDLDSYSDMDFADLGDNEAHPVARYLLHGGRQGGAPGNLHQH